MNKFFTILFFLVGCTFIGQAQMFPPDFICVKNDTLIWELPGSSCGPFISYQIYSSTDINGPYQLLTEVTTPGQTSYFPGNQGGMTVYYYLQSNFDCPGEFPIPSDTLNNRPPEISPLENVSVENNAINLNWEASPSPEVVGYIIYRETDIGVVPIDTVFGGLSYTDLSVDPNLKTESYFVNALDACGNTSIFDEAHHTIFLETSLSPCEQKVNLSWNLYENWRNGIDHHEIWASINGDPAQQVSTTGADAETFAFENPINGASYCFFVRAVEAGTDIISNSNVVCVTTNVVQANDLLFIKNITVNALDEVEVFWAWNTDAEINKYDIQQAIDGTTFQTIFSENITPPLDPENRYTDNTVDPNAGRVFYQIRTNDACDTMVTSTAASTVFLTGVPLADRINQLTWTTLNIENAKSTTYEIYKTVAGIDTKVGFYSTADNPHLDQVNPAALAESNVCYYVIATFSLLLPDGTFEIIESRSNTVCVEQFADLLIPNAFAPRGQNQVFKPIIVLGEAANYQMLIYDRWGQQVFESNDISQGWDGTKNGSGVVLPQGGYVYQIQLTQSNGNIVNKKGIVILLK